MEVVDFSNFIVVWAFDEALRVDVGLDLRDALHAVRVISHMVIVVVEGVLGCEVDEVEKLKEDEVQVSQIAANDEMSSLDVLDESFTLGEGIFLKICAVVGDVALSNHGRSDVLKLHVEHVNLCLLLDVFSEKLWGVGVAQVHHDSKRISDSYISIDDVRHIWEVKTKGILD